MEDLVIIEYNTLSVHFFKVSTDANIDEDYIRKLGFNPNECSWMFGEYIEVIKHKGICL